MQRIQIQARPDWKEQVEADGVLWSTTENGAYWNESMVQPVYYKFTKEEQQQLEQAGNECHEAALECVNWLLEEASDTDRNKWFDRFAIPMEFRTYIMKTWDNDEWGVYGRFDFVMTNDGPKLLEYNADTPTTLIETAITQWNWFDQNREVLGDANQFNELHEALVNHWKDMSASNGLSDKVYFAACEQVDDMATVIYMAETAGEAGLSVSVLPIDTIGLNGVEFTDPEEEHIKTCFKLYPWEWMTEDEFGKYTITADTRWIEPSWKMLLSNKAILALLWERHSNLPWLVPATLEEPKIEVGEKWVTKPLLSREGCNVTIWEKMPNGQVEIVHGTDGNYDTDESIYQKYIEWKSIDGCYPMIGVWIVGNDAVAVGIREDDTVITQNNSRFIPHVFGV